MRIVIVEDETRVRAGIVRLIHRKRPAYLVVGESSNGVEGMHMIKQLNPDLVITDIRMARMDGLKMIRNLRECGLTTAIVILSAYSDFEYAKTAIHYGVSEYLLKPVTADELTEVLDRLKRNIVTDRDDITAPSPGYSPMVEAVISWIKTNYQQRITLEQLSERLRISASYLSTLFSRETGFTFSSYLRDYRIERAKELLLAGNCRIYEIAYRTGFDDTQYFCRVFKSVTGSSATQYMRRHRGTAQ